MRTVVLDPKAERVLDLETVNYPGLEDMYRSLEWRIVRDPEAGHRLKGSNPPTYIVKMKEWGSNPALVLVYQFSGDQILIKRARVRPAEALTSAI